MKTWTDIREWIAEENACIKKGYDSLTIWTGEEGAGKSYAMLMRHKLTEKSFNIEQVHFGEDDFMRDAVARPLGACIQLDEFDGHRRGSMTTGRRDFLKFLKERRSLSLRMGVGFPHINQLDRDILRSRVRYRAHVPHRGLLQVKTRQVLREDVDRQGNPYTIIRWVVRGQFPIPDMPPKHPLVVAYDKKKWDFTHRDPFEEEAKAARSFNADAAWPVLERIQGLLNVKAR